MSVRLPRDRYVRVDVNDYSVDPRVIGRRVEVITDLDRVQVACEGQLASDHARCWAAHQSMSDPEHAAAAVALRTAGRQTRSAEDPHQIEARDVSSYDWAFGVGGPVADAGHEGHPGLRRGDRHLTCALKARTQDPS